MALRSLVWLIGLASLGNIFVLMPRIYNFVANEGIPLDYVISPVDRLIWNTGLVYREAKMNAVSFAKTSEASFCDANRDS